MTKKRHRTQALAQMQQEKELEGERRAAMELRDERLKLEKEAQLLEASVAMYICFHFGLFF